MRKSIVQFVASALLLLSGADELRADLTVELRAVSVSDGFIVDPHHVVVTGGAGTTVSMQVWAHLPDHDGNLLNDGLIYFDGSLLSSLGGLQGDLRSILTTPFSSGLQGKIQDLDGDGDKDVGSNDPNTQIDFFAPNNDSGHLGTDHFVANLTWTSTGIGGTWTEINFRRAPNGNSALWAEDGQSRTPAVSGFFSGDAVEVLAPEPSMSITGAGLVICFFRRRALSRTCCQTPKDLNDAPRVTWRS